MAIFYLSAYTNTFDMAKKIQQGALSQDVKVKLYDLEKLSLNTKTQINFIKDLERIYY